ncbi:MAG: MGMT family protein [Minisyncoccia bacterium]
MKQSLKKDIYHLVKKIPRGKVTTYKIIAKKLNIKSYRVVGKVLNLNQDFKNIPCYRVVKSNGEIGGYILGVKEKIKKLKKDGIKIKNKKINLQNYLFKF